MKYTVCDEIGRGGFGVVHKVTDEKGDYYAMKTFAPASYIPTFTHDKLRKRFRREVMIQKELGGAEILPVLDSCLDIEDPWFVMPLAESTYDKHIEQYRSGTTIDVDAVADILNGLDFLHKHGFVHRDLNPKNILLHDKKWKLSDLGAVLPPTGMTVTLTEGTAIYTEQYCAPEQRHDFHSAKPPADIYSFGCILHDIFGTTSRIPYGRCSADGAIGIIIEKCTDPIPNKRPSIDVLRTLVIEALIEAGGLCKVVDEKAEEWLARLDNIADWKDAEYEAFARFYAALDITERSPGHENAWVYSLSTPFLTRLSNAALISISRRNDEVADAVIGKFCEWVNTTSFLFSYSDLICTRLISIYENGSLNHKAMSFASMLRLGASHNRFYIMREALARLSPTSLPAEMSKRIKIEIQVEKLEWALKHCVEATEWNVEQIHPDISTLLK